MDEEYHPPYGPKEIGPAVFNYSGVDFYKIETYAATDPCFYSRPLYFSMVKKTYGITLMISYRVLRV